MEWNGFFQLLTFSTINKQMPLQQQKQQQQQQ